MRNCLASSVALFAAVTGAIVVAPIRPLAAAEYPVQAIDLYIGSAPAGSTDVIGRVLAVSLEELLGQPVIVQNTPGAGGAVMATQLMNSEPDGYSLGLTISHAYSGNPVVMPDVTTYKVGDFTHLASVSKGQCALVTSSQKPYRALDDVIEAARRGEQPVFASQSPLTRIVADYIAGAANVKFRIITVQGGGEMMQTILGGHADFGFSGGPHVDHVAAGQMRVLAAAEDARLATSPDVPTLKELGYDISACALFVVSAPPRLPEDIKEQLSSALAQAVRSPEVTSLIRNLKLPEHYLGPDEVTQALNAEAGTLARAVARIDEAANRASGGGLSPAFMPYVAAGLGALALVLMLAARLTHTAGVAELDLLPNQSRLFLCIAIVVLAVSFTLMNLFGYLAGAAAIVAGFMTLARAKPIVVIVAAVSFPIALWALFDKLLGFPLP